jgi:hypothetical protein
MAFEPWTNHTALLAGIVAAREAHFEPWPLRQAILSALYFPEA